MRKKNGINMYIDYEKSYRRWGRRKSNTAFRIMLVLILAVGVGFGAYYAIKRQIDSSSPDHTGQNYSQSEGELKSEDQLTVEKTGPDMASDAASDSEAKDINDTSDTQGNMPGIEEEDTKEEVLLEEPDPRKAVRVKGIYVTSRAAMDMRDELVQIADTTEINAMVIDVKDDNGKITYNMYSKAARDIEAVTNTITDMENFLRALKEKNIYPIARIVAFKDPYLAEQKKELALKNKDGSLYRDNNGECWINPYNREVWDYLIEVASQAAAAGFSEIQFDYIRFSTGKGMSEVDFGPEAETKSKEEIIIEFTKYAYEKLKPLGVFVSADVYGTIISSSIDAGLVGQNYVEMSKYLDYICPMIYPSHFGEGNYGVEHPDLEPFKIVRKVLTASRTKLEQIPEGEHRAIVRPWLQDFTATWIKHYQEYGGLELREQIGGVYGAGYNEWLLWDAGCTYSVDGLHGE